MSGVHDARMEEDRADLEAIEAIREDTFANMSESESEELRERLAIVHQRMTEQFIERYGEQP